MKALPLEFRAFIATCVLAIAIALDQSCASTPNIHTPQGAIAYRADQVVLRVNELQATTIDAERTGALSTDVARAIVATCVSMNETLRATPQGWEQTVRVVWAELKFHIGTVTNASVSAALAIVDAMLEALL